jgi:regulator of protease activity HflC (stomatin/prohibitin superfamily)
VLEYESNLLYTEAALRGLQTAVSDFDELRERLRVILGLAPPAPAAAAGAGGGGDGDALARTSKSGVAWSVRTHSLSLASALPRADAREPAVNAMIAMLLDRMRAEQAQLSAQRAEAERQRDAEAAALATREAEAAREAAREAAMAQATLVAKGAEAI